ncbi:MAG TPA: cob(I)yrinic acid a,c-diamide adenosyltransferase [Oligoflexia bacterium]|nr:cob(I)yrinic acid a,c-diamide adenosyltransferase [Oligoflexia bacterium]HMR25296.1 cob(I)yrinic acid a,c-diamide adenosyltransferase [Oligoflexia bacterium]
MKIYTKTGDSGETSLFSGGRVQKNHPRVRAYGEVDELNSLLGCALSFCVQKEIMSKLIRIQNELFSLGAVLASPKENEYVQKLESKHIEALEKDIDAMESHLPALKNFILPGGTQCAAFLHFARTVCRRAERMCLDLHQQTAIDAWIIQYLNRLSDWLFVCARYENHLNKAPEIQWQQPQA